MDSVFSTLFHLYRTAEQLYAKISLVILALVVLLSLPACSVNPVTGKKELSWVSESAEIDIGTKQYAFQQQAGGGYYELDPDLTAYVQSVGKKIVPFSSRSHLPYEFVVINDSTPNAWALPGGKIAIHRGLLTELQDESELAAVLAHEIVHADARHSAQSQEVGSLISAGQLAANVILAQQGIESESLQQGLAYGGLYGQTRYGRKRELLADEYGMRYMSEAGYDPVGAINLQKTFVALSAGRRSDFFSELFASHPPSQSRVNANKKTARSLPPAGQRGRDRYQQELAKLRKRQPAYDKIDEAKKAAGEKDYRQAIALADQAIKMEPNEGLFFEIKGFAQSQLNRSADALKSYNEAVALNPGYFSPVLRRALLKHELKSFQAAEEDFRSSLAKLPTQIAYMGLGEIEEERNNCQSALQYYQQAQGAGGQNKDQLEQKILALQSTCR